MPDHHRRRDLALVSTANRTGAASSSISSERVVFDENFASELRLLQRSYVGRSVEVDPPAWRHRPWLRKLEQNAAGLLSPLL
jgi:hypothetical protein